MLTSKERVLKAVNHEIGDRTPITFDAEQEVYDMLYNKLNLNTKEELLQHLHVDTRMILPKNFLYPEEELSKRVKKSIWGWKAELTEYTGGAYDELSWSPLADSDDISDIDELDFPDSEDLDFSHYPREIEKHSDKAIIGVFTWGAYFLATHIRGLQQLLMDFALNQKYAEHLIGRIADRSCQILDDMLEKYGDGIDIVYMADDYCSQRSPLFSPQDFERFVVPYLTRIVDKVHQAGKKFLLHVCGAVRPLLPHIVDAGVDMLEPIQTRAKGMNPEELKREFGDDLCFYGGLDLQQILADGSQDDVANETKRLIDILGKNGGYVFGPGHTYIQIDAPFENIMTMYRTAYNYRPHSQK